MFFSFHLPSLQWRLFFLHFCSPKYNPLPQPQIQPEVTTIYNYILSVSFSSCQRNLIKTFQIESMIALITKMTLIFSSDLLNGQKQLSKKAKFFRIFSNKSRSILMLHKITKNKKCAPKLIFFNEFFFRKIRIFFDVEN